MICLLLSVDNDAISLINRYYRILLSVIVPTAAVMAAVCFFVMMVSKSDRAVSEARAWLSRILIAFVAILALGMIITVILTLVNNIFDMSGYVPALR